MVNEYIRTTTGKDGKEYKEVKLNKLDDNETTCNLIVSSDDHPTFKGKYGESTLHKFKLEDGTMLSLFAAKERTTVFGVLLNDVLNPLRTGDTVTIQCQRRMTDKSPKGYFINYAVTVQRATENDVVAVERLLSYFIQLKEKATAERVQRTATLFGISPESIASLVQRYEATLV